MNPNRIAFVYQNIQMPKWHAVVWIEDCAHHPDTEWRHTATLDPAVWIRELVNATEAERTAMIQELIK